MQKWRYLIVEAWRPTDSIFKLTFDACCLFTNLFDKPTLSVHTQFFTHRHITTETKEWQEVAL
jgi:hypothetical protein